MVYPVAFSIACFAVFSSKKAQSDETEAEFLVTVSSVHLPSR